MSKLKKTFLTVVAISSISIGSVMANQDAGSQIGDWYNKLFNQSEQSVLDETNSYSESMKQGFEEEISKLIGETEARLVGSEESETNRATTEIDSYTGQYVEQMQEKHDQLMGGQIESDFQLYEEAKKSEIEATINGHADQFLSEVKKELDEEANN